MHGAHQPKAGLFHAAHHGTPFLDEVGPLPEAAPGEEDLFFGSDVTSL